MDGAATGGGRSAGQLPATTTFFRQTAPLLEPDSEPVARAIWPTGPAILGPIAAGPRIPAAGGMLNVDNVQHFSIQVRPADCWKPASLEGR
ncbi:hypothetical protein [Rhizosaccharibacter radicis]|uniref:Uncharacterized protein n=1 Tax=Rhizosaccharibacter radicis TaxID=2782605 RepID=A0ABT1VZW9_9PROT|nr:hypothetical protein [Acetobacteraceae bacterium KSS12]